jgi:hypothetical protein
MLTHVEYRGNFVFQSLVGFMGIEPWIWRTDCASYKNLLLIYSYFRQNRVSSIYSSILPLHLLCYCYIYYIYILETQQYIVISFTLYNLVTFKEAERRTEHMYIFLVSYIGLSVFHSLYSCGFELTIELCSHLLLLCIYTLSTISNCTVQLYTYCFIELLFKLFNRK